VGCRNLPVTCVWPATHLEEDDVRQHHRHRLALAVATAAAGVVPVLCAGTAAAAAAAPLARLLPAAAPVTMSLTPTSSAWFWREQNATAGPLSGPKLTDPSVPDKALAVAGPEQADPSNAAGQPQPDKEAYLGFDLSAVPAGSTITAFTITAPLSADPGARQAVQPGSLPDLLAVRAKGSFLNGAFGAPLSAKPTDDLVPADTVVVKGDPAKSTYTLSIPSIAQRWLTEGADGVGLRPKAGDTTPFQVVLSPASAITATMTYQPPDNAADSTGGMAAPAGGGSAAVAAAPAPASVAAVAPKTSTAPRATATATPAVGGGTTSSGGIGTTSTGTGGSTGGSAPVDLGAAPGALAAPQVPAPVAAPAPELPQPAAAAPAPAAAVKQALPAATRPVAVKLASNTGTTIRFLLAILLVAALLVAAAIGLASPVPTAAGRREGGVNRALRAARVRPAGPPMTAGRLP